MNKAYVNTAKVGVFKACLRYIEDPNRNIFSRIFLAISPILAVMILSPLDLLPEAFLGPLGLTDDILILVGLFMTIRLANNFYHNKKYSKKANIKESNVIDI
jgi:uncharacterized membrane protein YkvA (DUF1232 family)